MGSSCDHSDPEYFAYATNLKDGRLYVLRQCLRGCGLMERARVFPSDFGIAAPKPSTERGAR